MSGEVQELGTIVVVGGGCYGSYYVRQLARAAAAGAMRWRRLLVVDRDPDCRVARERRLPPSAELVVDEWAGFMSVYLAHAALDPSGSRRDAIVPSPLMPHLLYEWLLARARERWPARQVATRPLERDPAMPWQRAAPDGTHYVSFAEWTCPINCIEPQRCPATRAARTWSLPAAVREYVSQEARRGHGMWGPVVFHCSHRAYGVGMIDTRDVVAADDLVRAAGDAGAAEVLVGTVSHCHGALSLLAIGDPVPLSDNARTVPSADWRDC